MAKELREVDEEKLMLETEYGNKKVVTTTSIRQVDQWWIRKNYNNGKGGLCLFIKKYVDQEIKKAGIAPG